jgi:hypothetical protein
MKNNLLITLAAILIFLPFSSCENKDEAEDIRTNLAGTWQLASVRIDGLAVDTGAYPEFIRLQENRIFLSYDAATELLIRGGWSYEGNMLNISTDLPAAYYIEQADGKTLSLKRLDFNADGKLSTTVRDYRRTDDSQIPE